MPNEGKFLPQLTVNRGKKLLFTIHSLTFSRGYFFQVFMVQTWVIGETAVIFVCHQNGEYLVNSWGFVWEATESAHKFYSINIYMDVSTFELS